MRNFIEFFKNICLTINRKEKAWPIFTKTRTRLPTDIYKPEENTSHIHICQLRNGLADLRLKLLNASPYRVLSNGF